MLIVLLDKIGKRIIRFHRKHCFKKYTKTKHNSYSLIGKVNLINYNILVGKNITIYPDVTFYGDGPILLGDNVTIGQGTIFYSSKDGGGIEIGDNTMIAAQSFVIDSDHGYEKGSLIREQKLKSAKVTIGKNCWIGAGAKILKGTNLGDGCVVGAQSVIKGSFESDSVIVGVPGKIIKKR